MPPKKITTETGSPSESLEGTPIHQHSQGQETEDARENLEHLNLKETQPTPQGSELEPVFQDQSEDKDEDVVMKEASELIKEQLAPLMVNKKKDPVLVLKKVIARRDTYLNLYTDMVNTEASDEKAIKHLGEIRMKIEGLNKDISLLKNSVRLSNEKVSASVESSFIASNGGIRLSKLWN
ncbi:unnamed protein product [Mucor fragilis]